MRKTALLVSLVLIVALFAVGCGKSGDNGKSGDKTDDANSVAKVNGVQISTTQLDERVARMEASVGHQGANLSDEQKETLMEGLKKEALTQLIQEQLITQEAEKRGIKIDEAKAKEHLEQIKSQFKDDEEYQKGLEQYSLTEEALIEYFEYQLAEDAVFQAVTKDVSVSDKALEDYYNENKENLIQMKARHILIQAAEGTATEEEMQQAKEKAQSIIEELNNGADFIQVAKEKSEGPSAPEGGLLDMYFGKQGSNLVQEFVDGAFLLDEGQYSKEPVKTSFGYHIIKVEEKQDTLDELKSKIQESLLYQAKSEAFNTFFTELKDKADIENNL